MDKQRWKKKSAEDFANKLLKLLFPGVPLGTLHGRKDRLVEAIEERDQKWQDQINYLIESK